MKSTSQKLILISFILALIAAVNVFMYLQSLKAPKKNDKKITVLVANETIPARTLIDNKMIKKIQVVDNNIFGDYINDSSKIVGKYAKDTILKNEGFHIDKMLEKNGNELSFKINNNYRAISISATGDSGVSDLIKPGDFVDIIVYAAEKKDGAKVVRPDIAKIILQNVELLAVNKQLNREEKVNADTGAAENNLNNFLVTLSVPTADLEKLVLAESIGTIKLALRPLKDNNSTQTNGTTWDKLSINANSINHGNGAALKQNNVSSGSNGNKKYTNYTVKRKDTLKKISRKFYGDESKYTIIKQANNIQNENMIETRQVIKIPILQQ